jgi:acyl phosphate:glycerol-3-phosphate acyltransferase
MASLLFIAVVGYLLGSIPFGYLLMRFLRGQDIRQTGSGNIGATNVARSSPQLGLLTLLLDAAKGIAAVVLAAKVLQSGGDQDRSTIMALASLCAIIGHVFPVWLRFRGGKGVATAVGAFAVVSPGAVLVTATIFTVIVAATRYVSLGSVTAAAVFPLIVRMMYRDRFSVGAMIILLVASIVVIARHHQNIGRLLAGTESRFQLRRG